MTESSFSHPARWRMIHTNAVAYGFIASAFLGVVEWSVPRLTLQPVLSRKLSYFIFFAWQVIVLGTAAAIIVGPNASIARVGGQSQSRSAPADESWRPRTRVGRNSVLD